jgi:hypothetical protein
MPVSIYFPPLSLIWAELYVYMYIYICMYIHKYVYTCMFVSTCICMYTFIFINIYVCIYIDIHMHVYLKISDRIHLLSLYYSHIIYYYHIIYSRSCTMNLYSFHLRRFHGDHRYISHLYMPLIILVQGRVYMCYVNTIFI